MQPDSPRDQALRVIGKMWLYGTAFVGNCGCILLLIAGFSIYSLVTTVTTTVEDFSSEVGLQDNVKIVYEDPGWTDQIAVISVDGVILDGQGDSFGEQGVASADKIIQKLDDALAEPAVKAIILSVNSPGGSVVASDKIYQAVQTVNAKKPVIALMHEVAASGGYYISAPASAIVAHPDTFTGSIGVIMSMQKYKGLYEKLGLEEVVIKSGAKKDIGSSVRDMTEDERALLQSIIDEAFQQFLGIVQKHRTLSEQQLATIKDGRVVSGRMALELGLVDSLGVMADAITLAKQKASLTNVQVIQPEETNFLDMLFSATQVKLPILGLESLQSKPIPGGLLYLWDNGL